MQETDRSEGIRREPAGAGSSGKSRAKPDEGEAMGKYDDIINMPHHVSATRPHMSLHDRAAQFAPFAALNGYEEEIDDTAKQFYDRMEAIDRRNNTGELEDV